MASIMGATYRLRPADRGHVLRFTSDADVNLLIPADLGDGFDCVLVQIGEGHVVPLGEDWVTVGNADGHTKTARRLAVASLIAVAADSFVLAGHTS